MWLVWSHGEGTEGTLALADSGTSDAFGQIALEQGESAHCRRYAQKREHDRAEFKDVEVIGDVVDQERESHNRGACRDGEPDG